MLQADHDDRPQLFYSYRWFICGRSEVVLGLKVVDRVVAEFHLWEEVTIEFLLEQVSAVVPIFGVAFGQRPSINAQDKGFPLMRANDLDATDILLKLYNNLLAEDLLLLREDNRIPLLLAVLIPDHNPVEGW